MEDRKTYKLSEVASVQTGPFGSQLHKKDYVEVGTPIITVEHLGENRIIHENLPRVSDKDKDRLDKYSLRINDIVFSRVGSVDRRALVRESENGWLFSGRCLRVRTNTQVINPLFLSFYFGQESFKEYIRAIAVGATMPSINTKILSQIDVTLPPIEEQKAIAKILSSLDDKIELNRKMNATLEEMARAVFKAWFVDFEPIHANAENRPSTSASPEIAKLFPSEFQESELGLIPTGWEESGIGKIISVQNGYAFKSKDFIENGTNGVLKIKNISNNLVDIINLQHINQKVAKTIDEKFKVQSGDILIAMTGAKVGKVGIVPQTENALWLNQRVGNIKEKLDFSKWFAYLVLSTNESQNLIYSTALGSAQPNISGGELENIKILMPNPHLVKSFGKLVNPIFKKICEHHSEDLLLGEIRDSLLPRLISGKIAVGEIEQEVADAI